MTGFKRRVTRCLSALITCALMGCQVGPDYEAPDESERVADQFRQSTGDTVVDGVDAGRRVSTQQLADWWKTLDDPLLVSLIERSIDDNLTLRGALARLRQVRSQRQIAGTQLSPSIGASQAVQETSRGGRQNTLYSSSLDASWEIDLFGGLRRGVEAAQADLEAVEQNVADVAISLASEVALSYVEVRSFALRLVIARRNAEKQEETLAFVQSRADAGLVNQRDVQQALSNLATTRSGIPVLEAGLTRARNGLAVLVGQPPGALDGELGGSTGLPVVPAAVAVGIPAEVLRRRPDVRAAERRLASETARIGVVESDLYPRLSLDGSIGVEAATFAGLFSNPTDVFGIGPRLSWNIFDFGRTKARIASQTAVRDEMLADYEQSILRALEDVEGAVVDFANEKVRQQQLFEAVEAANSSLTLAQDQYRAGLIDFVVVLDSERQVLTLEDQQAVSQVSPVESKPAIDGRFKTGHPSPRRRYPHLDSAATSERFMR